MIGLKAREQQKLSATHGFGSSMVHFTGFLFIIGGFNSGRLVSVFTMDRNEWQAGPQLNQGRYEASSCVFGHFIYTFGGG